MDLRNHLANLAQPAREELAEKCKTTVGHLKNVAYGYRTPSPELCVLLEQETGTVTRQELVDNWQAIWPELAIQSDVKAPSYV